jgi:hypothetical protein
MTHRTVASRHELRFRSLYDPNRALGFPCDSTGCVDVYKLSALACTNYVLARASIGRDYSAPVVVSAAAAYIDFAE